MGHRGPTLATVDAPALVDLPSCSRADPRLRVELLQLTDVLRAAPASFARHDFSLVVLPTAGRVSIEVDFAHLVVGPGTVLQVLPGQVHRWGRHDARAQAVLLLAHRDVAEVWDLDPPPWRGSSAVLAPSGEELRLLAAVLGSLRAAQASFDGSAAIHRSMELLVGVVANQLAVAREHIGATGCPTSPLTREFFSVVASNGTVRSVRDVAAELGYSPRHLSRIVGRDTGRSPTVWLQERTLLEAKRLLVHTDLTAAAIAGRLGFVDASHFGRAFKRGTGCTTREFRAPHLGRSAGADGPAQRRTGT